MPKPLRMGYLYVMAGRAKEIFSFEYDDNWLQSPFAQVLDPSLQLYSGEQYAPDGQENLSVFLDSAPDRWGEVLMRRREALCAREEGRAERPLYASDYLLGVFDELRMGALRFKRESDGPFEAADAEFASSPWTSLGKLEHASRQLEKEGAEDMQQYREWLRMLIAPGGSLGGARPKAGVVDSRNTLWIAKFPSASDDWDVGAWEMVLSRLAAKVGIELPRAQVQVFGGPHHTFLIQRFDRGIRRERIHFASAMTLLQRVDGDDGSTGANYLELAEFIIRNGARVQQDLAQLWIRIVFFICVSNTDDHLRNHGFLLGPKGWALSPAYDMNPNPHGNGLTLNISESDNAQDLELVRGVAKFFRVGAYEVNSIIDSVVSVVSEWRNEASKLGISKGEQNRMARSFRLGKKP